jgi:hypothetical protein
LRFAPYKACQRASLRRRCPSLSRTHDPVPQILRRWRHCPPSLLSPAEWLDHRSAAGARSGIGSASTVGRGGPIRPPAEWKATATERIFVCERRAGQAPEIERWPSPTALSPRRRGSELLRNQPAVRSSCVRTAPTAHSPSRHP